MIRQGQQQTFGMWRSLARADDIASGVVGAEKASKRQTRTWWCVVERIFGTFENTPGPKYRVSVNGVRGSGGSSSKGGVTDRHAVGSVLVRTCRF